VLRISKSGAPSKFDRYAAFASRNQTYVAR
jgi:hypothetical protein